MSPDSDARDDQLQSIEKPIGCHKSPQEAIKVIKRMTHFLAFPILCGLTYMLYTSSKVKRYLRPVNGPIQK